VTWHIAEFASRTVNIRTVAIIAVISGFAACALAQQKLVPIEIQLPKPQFQGTPAPIKHMPNLEKMSGRKRPSFMAPEGTVNLSVKKSVSASDPFPIIGELSMVTDGNKEGVDGSFVELGPGVQWAQVDLGRKSEISAIVLWLFHAQPRVYHDVIVQISDDEDFIADVKTIFNNDHDNSAGMGIGNDPAYFETYEGKLIDARGEKGRFVRVFTNGSTTDELNRFTEIEIWGQ
jgi:hypothetical protein